MPSKVALKDAINESPIKWAKQIKADLGDSNLLDLCPLHACVGYFADSNGNKAWEQFAISNAAINFNSSFTLADLAVQFYQEGLLLKTEQN